MNKSMSDNYFFDKIGYQTLIYSLSIEFYIFHRILLPRISDVMTIDCVSEKKTAVFYT